MGTRFNTSKEKFEYRMTKDSVEKDVTVFMKPFTTWKAGKTFLQVKAEIEKRRKRTFSDGRIYEAISLINRYGSPWGIYLRSGFGNSEDGKNEYRYFVPTEQYDVSLEKKDLEHRKEIVEEKEEHIEHHEKVTIPQEITIAQIQN